MARVLVIALRLIASLTIFRFPLAGGIAAMIVDALDVVLVDSFAARLREPPGFGTEYAAIDKGLDTLYLGIECSVAWRWREQMLRRTALALFAWRLIGVVAYEITGIRVLLFVFPNLFENFYLYALITRRWLPKMVPTTPRALAIVLGALLVPKLAQEYVLHWAEIHPWEMLKKLRIGS